MNKIRTTGMYLHTPLGRIEIQNKIVPEVIVSTDELNEMTSEWQTVLSNTDSFKFPTQNNKLYVLPGQLLKQSYIEIDFEEIK